MTVKEFVIKHKSDKRNFWLCPNIVRNQSITVPNYLCGIEVSTIAGIPNEIINKEVHKTWVEDGFYCIIWRNE